MTLRWRLYALVKRRPFPYVLQGYQVYWCYFCCGWGDDPRDGSECPLCHGQGFVNRQGIDRKPFSAAVSAALARMNAFIRRSTRRTFHQSGNGKIRR